MRSPSEQLRVQHSPVHVRSVVRVTGQEIVTRGFLKVDPVLQSRWIVGRSVDAQVEEVDVVRMMVHLQLDVLVLAVEMTVKGGKGVDTVGPEHEDVVLIPCPEAGLQRRGGEGRSFPFTHVEVCE